MARKIQGKMEEKAEKEGERVRKSELEGLM